MAAKTTPTAAARIAKVRRLCRTGEAKNIRRAAGLSMREIAEDVGTTYSSVWRWEQGSRLPRSEAALRYEAVLAELARGLEVGGRG